MRDLNREVVQRRLEALGFTVHPLAETADSRQPDLAAQVDGATMYVEVKTRTEDRVLRSKMEAVLVGETVEILTGLDKHNGLSAEIKHGASQLCAAASPDDLRLLWYRADNGPFVNDSLELIGATLYGMRMVLINSLGGQQQKQCAYAGYADFYRFPEIDGVMVEVDDRITLFLNPFSPRKIAFAASPIAKAVHPSVFDVEQAGAGDTLFIADGDAPRRNDEDLLKHLEAKYPSFQFVRFLQHCAGTVMTTIDGSQEVPNKSLQPIAPKNGAPAE